MRESNLRSSTKCKRQVNSGVLDLPYEMISEIFSRLSTESILICRVVCKSWYALTQDPCFINRLGNSHYQPTRLILKPLPVKDVTYNFLILVDIENQKTRQIPLEKMFGELQIACSCNGFLCMAPPKKVDPVVIYNPITRDHLILPPSDSKSAVKRQEIGLGLDPSTGKYKFVKGYTGFPSMHTVRRFEIISLGESSWRELSAPQCVVNGNGSGVIFLSGALYWTMSEGNNTIIFVQFNLSDEKFRVISFPASFSPRHVSLGLMDIRGIVILVQCNSRGVRSWKIRDGKGEGELSFFLDGNYDSQVKWGDGLSFVFVRPMNKECNLLQVGYWNSKNERREHLTRYFPGKVQYLDLKLRGLPYSFKTLF